MHSPHASCVLSLFCSEWAHFVIFFFGMFFVIHASFLAFVMSMFKKKVKRVSHLPPRQVLANDRHWLCDCPFFRRFTDDLFSLDFHVFRQMFQELHPR